MWRAIYHEFRRWAKASESAWAVLRRTEITVETDRVWIVRKSGSTRFWCASCGREADVVGLNDVPALPGVSPSLLSNTGYEHTQQEQNLKEKDNEKH